MICIYLLIYLQVSAMVGSIYILALAIIACAYGKNTDQQIISLVFGNTAKGNSFNEQPTNEAINVRSSC